MNLPPPSYETATGEPEVHNQNNPYSKRVSPTAPPPQNDEIINVAPDTTPIFPRPNRSKPSSDVQPNNENLHPETSPEPKTIYLYRRYRNQKCPPWICYLIIFILVVCAVVVVIGVLKAKNQKPKIDFSQISENHYDTARDSQDKWWKENEQMIKDIQDRANKVLEDGRNNPF